MKAYERLLKYVTFETKSSETSGKTPSTDGQLVLGDYLVGELASLGYKAEKDEYGYVYAHADATPGCENVTPIGFIAHMDTSPDASGKDVKPRLINDYDGGDVTLGCGRTLKTSDFPHLASLKGRTLIVTDGSTLLGADDKAGIAEIMTLAEKLKDMKHGSISIAFTPDEEIGEGADHFNVEKFGAKYAYTVDGGEEGGVEYENFNAAAARVTFKGFSVHPGSSKNTMINASLVAMEFNSMLPSSDTPRNTEGYQGFFHLTDMKGDVSDAELCYIIRDHSAGYFDFRQDMMKHTADLLNEKYGEGTVTVEIREQYRNMYEVVEPHKEIISIACKASDDAGAPHKIEPIRGGTDGARLSYMGLPCPNLGTGGYAFHGEYEHITVEGMDKVVCILENIVTAFANE